MASSWRERAAHGVSRGLAAVKHQVAQIDQALRDEGGYSVGNVTTVALGKSKAADGGEPDEERVYLFPGWATRRYKHSMPTAEEPQGAEFTIEIAISGFAASFYPPERASRAQKTLLRVARGFAALPALVEEAVTGEPPPPPPPPTPPLYASMQLSPSTEALLATKRLPPRPSDITLDSERVALRMMYEDDGSSDDGMPGMPMDSPPPAALAGLTPEEIRRLHLNLHTRLRVFWSSLLAARGVRLAIFLDGPLGADVDDDGPGAEPLVVQDVTTDAQGAFALRVLVPWERMCTHPRGVYLAFGERAARYCVRIHAQLLPAPPPAPPTGVFGATVTVPLTHARVRVISDIDDTVKSSEILRGPRTAFQNVFVRAYGDVVIQDMVDWYGAMHDRGVRFHYVSNSPFELLPVLSEFLQESKLPEGSLKLKSYGGRTLLSGLWTPAAERKRAGVLEVLDAFLSTQFFLVGDSGEQDMELYASIAQARPFQILGVFVRDVSSPLPHELQRPARAPGAPGAPLTPAERRDFEFRARVERARAMIPRHVAFRVFRTADECVETERILDRLGL